MDKHTFFRNFPFSYSSHSHHQNAKCRGSPLVMRYTSTCSEISSGVLRSSAYCFLKRSHTSLATIANLFRQLLRQDEIYMTKVKMKTYKQENTCQATPHISVGRSWLWWLLMTSHWHRFLIDLHMMNDFEGRVIIRVWWQGSAQLG